MSHTRLAACCLAMSSLIAVPAANAQAQRPAPPAQAQPSAAAKPYKQVAITPAAPNTDASFEAFRKQLGDVANRKDRAALANLVSNNFFWLGPKGDKADKRKSGIDNLAEAFDLNASDGSGWEGLADFAQDPTLQPIPQRRGVSCAPAQPSFDVKAMVQLTQDTKTNAGDWGYPNKPAVDVHASADAKSPVVDKLGMYLVRILDDDAAGAADSSFAHVVTPAGKTGFVSEEDLETLDTEHLCYLKDGSGWKITGVFGSE